MKKKLPKLYICLQLAIRILPELLEVVQSENMWSFFCDPIDNFEQVSQITLTCLLPNLPAFFVRETFHSIQHCFYKANIFHISWSFISNFFIVLWLQKMCEILKATARYWENNFFFGKLLWRTPIGYYAIGSKFSAKQIKLVRKKGFRDLQNNEY